jgi:hypothetical protein
MNLDRLATAAITGVITIAILTTALGRSNTPRVIDSLGRAFSSTINAALGANARLS